MNSKITWVVISVVVVLSFVLASCSSGGASTTPPTTAATTTTAPTSAAPTTTTAKPTTSTPATTTSAPATSKPATTTAASPTATGPTPKKGGILKIITGGPTNMGIPTEANSPPDLWYTNPVVETLLLTDKQGNPIPRLATSWTVAPDGKSVTFVLRKGVKFQDGTDFNAQALKFDLENYAKSPMPELKFVTSVDVIDDYTAKVNFSSPSSVVFLSFMAVAKPGWMVSPTATQKMTPDQLRLNPVGTGPFTVSDYKQDVYMKFTKNPNYWQAGKPYLDGIEYDIITDSVTSLISFRSGAQQVSYNLSPKDAYDLKNAGFVVNAAQASIYQYIPDSGNPNSPWANADVRRAAQYAIDTVAMAKAQGFGWADPYWNQVFPKGNPAYDPTIVGYPYDPGKAKQLLAKAGYPNGFKTSQYNNVPPVGDLEPAVQNYLAAVGIQSTLVPLPGASYNQANTQGWQNGLFRSQSVASLGADPLYQMNTYVSTPARGWVSMVRPQDMQDLLNKANNDADPTTRTADIKALCKNLIDTNALIISTWGGYLLAAQTPEVMDANIRTLWTMTWTPENAWLNTK